MFSLAACVDPLSDVERVENIELAEDTPKVSVLPDPEDIAPRIGVLSGLLRRGVVQRTQIELLRKSTR
jgi:hypothetical protein